VLPVWLVRPICCANAWADWQMLLANSVTSARRITCKRSIRTRSACFSRLRSACFSRLRSGSIESWSADASSSSIDESRMLRRSTLKSLSENPNPRSQDRSFRHADALSRESQSVCCRYRFRGSPTDSKACAPRAFAESRVPSWFTRYLSSPTASGSLRPKTGADVAACR
jgi:hypothetical protein